MTMTWRPRDSRGHYLASKDVHTTLGPEDWDDTCRHQQTVSHPQASQDDFGHWPTTGISLFDLSATVCQRCTEWGVWYSHGADELTPARIPWPCTSAIVLGLVPRPCSYCNGKQSDPDDPGDWIPEVGMHNPYSSAPCPECHGTGHAATPQ